MKKNVFNLILGFTGALFLFVSSDISSRELVEGEDYEVISPKGSKEKEIIEFFSYACGACYGFQPFINAFEDKHKDIKVISVPTDLGNPGWSIYIKAFYMSELLKVKDKSHGKIFHQIHVEKKHIFNEEDLKAFFVELGVDAAKYDAANESFMLDAKIRKAKQMLRKYRISSTPTFVANQKYKLDNRALATKEMIEKALVELTSTK